LTGCGQEFQHITLLLSERRDHSQNPFDETCSFLALGTEGFFPPHHRSTQAPLRLVIGWFDLRHTHEGPQRSFPLQDLPTTPTGLGSLALDSGSQQTSDLPFDWFDPPLELLPTQPAFSILMPEGKHFIRLFEQVSTNLSRWSGPFREGLEFEASCFVAREALKLREWRQAFAPNLQD
jgi:hypothetical protein